MVTPHIGCDTLKPSRLLYLETETLAVEIWGPDRVPEAVEPYGTRRRYPKLRVTAPKPYILQPDTPEHQPIFFENTTYQLIARTKNQVKAPVVRHRDPLMEQGFYVSRVDPDVTVGSFIFRNQVGRSTFTFLIDEQKCLDLELEVFPMKLDYEEDFWDLLAEVSQHVYNLAFEFIRSTYQGAVPTKTQGTRTDLEWLLLLDYVFQDLERAVHQIARQPHRTLVQEPIVGPSARVKRPDRLVRTAVRTAARKGCADLTNVDQVPIPERLRANRPRPHLNTPENKWLRCELELVRRRLADVHTRVRATATVSGRAHFREAAARIRHFETRLDQLLQLEPLVLATGAPTTAHSSLVFRAAPGYREAFRCCLTLRLGLRIQADALQLSLKDLSDLYEYWCVLALLDIVTARTGGKFEPQTLVERSPGGLSLRLRRGRRLLIDVRRDGRTICSIQYNPRIDTVTGAQRPDILLTFHPQGWQTPVEIVLDAKYRVVGDRDYLDKYGTPGPPEDAVNQLYRYRDAIVDNATPPRRRVVHATALFPFRDTVDLKFADNRLYHSLDSVGIGALPFLPSETSYVEEWLAKNCRRSGTHFAERTVGVLLRDEELATRAKMAEAVLIGVVGHGQQQWEWIRQRRQYLVPLTRISKHRRLDVKWLAFFESVNMTGKEYGVVRHYARVQGIELVKRGEINTPWIGRGQMDEPYLLFYLDQIKQLLHPIWNTDRHRVVFRWATLYALENAHSMSELYLETEAERRLWEELRQAGIKFTTEAGQVTPIDPNDPRGRTTFILADGQVRIRYQGRGEFRVWGRSVDKPRIFTVTDLRLKAEIILSALMEG
jgi:hypothetical protein